MSRQPLSFTEKFLFIGSGCLCLVILGISKFYMYQNELPPQTVAIFETPNPNAFDAILKASLSAPLLPNRITNRDTCRSSNVDRELTCEGTLAPNQPKAYRADYNKNFPATRKNTYLNLAGPSLDQWRKAKETLFYVPPEKENSFWILQRLDDAARTKARVEWQNHRTDEALE
jgi:hypothetical protein